MRYSVNYEGRFFIDDTDRYNTQYFSRFEAARNFLWDIIQSGIDDIAYLKDEEYQCTLHWDSETKEFYWEA
jgi:hypothetical protein